MTNIDGSISGPLIAPVSSVTRPRFIRGRGSRSPPFHQPFAPVSSWKTCRQRGDVRGVLHMSGGAAMTVRTFAIGSVGPLAGQPCLGGAIEGVSDQFG